MAHECPNRYYNHLLTHASSKVNPYRMKAVFVDIDGTLVVDVPRNGDPGKVHVIEDTVRIVRSFYNDGHSPILITNKGAALATGSITFGQAYNVMDEILKQCALSGLYFSALYYCPHFYTAGVTFPSENIEEWNNPECLHRKPNPGMLLTAADDLNINLSESWMIGNSIHDEIAGRNAGCKTMILGINKERHIDGNYNLQ
jgi:D-glycero-D-manno-heptose 1,7-bisphosphate phosphatase